VSASAVILAAGAGTRFGGAGNKVWALLAGQPLLWHGLAAFAACGAVDEIVIVIRSGDEERLASLPPVGLPLHRVVGGERRADSAWAGLSRAGGEYVLVHDGARPLVTPDLIQRVLAAARHHGAAVPILPVADTVRRARDQFLGSETLDRRDWVLIQTPQGFRRDLLLTAYAEAHHHGLDLPDDAAAVLSLGHPVATVPGDPANLKVTRPEDLTLAKRILAGSTP